MSFSAVLLVGGESRRMGRDKATILFRGCPLWQGQLRLLREVDPEKVFVSSRSKPDWLPCGTELLLDEPPSRGPLSGLALALQRMETTHLIALAVDMPFMTGEQLRFLCNLVTIGCGVLSMVGDRAEPLASIYPREAGTELCAALAGDDFSLQRLSRRLVQGGKLGIFQVSEEGAQLYRSLNEPEDLKDERFPMPV